LGALAMSALVFHQLLRHRLYVGYAVAWLMVIFGLVCLAAIPPLSRAAARMAEAFFPSAALTVVSLGFVTLVLIYFSVQLSMLSERVTKIAQALAISNLEGGDASGARSGDAEGL
jgi:hypothetical protein